MPLESLSVTGLEAIPPNSDQDAQAVALYVLALSSMACLKKLLLTRITMGLGYMTTGTKAYETQTAQLEMVFLQHLARYMSI
jgi:hypothetical protein